MFYLCEICLFFTLINVQSCLTNGVCSRKESVTSNDKTHYYTKQFCCDNYHGNLDQGCKKCERGFTSKGGATCSPCPDNTYGFRCAEKCQCNKHERCDIKVGCVSKVDDIEHMLYTMSTSAFDKATAKELSTEYLYTSRTLKTTVENNRFDNTNNERLSETKIIGISIGGTAMILSGCGIYFVFMYTRRWSSKTKTSKSMKQDITITVTDNNDDAINVESNIQRENVYEEIDEQMLCPESVLINIQEKKIIFNTSGAIVKVASSKSLNNINNSGLTMRLQDRDRPHSFVSSLEPPNRHLCSMDTESLLTQFQAAKIANSSICRLEAIEMASTEWLNDMATRFFHDNKSADSSSSTSESSEICADGYLNPYQPLICGKHTVHMNADQVGQYSKLCQKYQENDEKSHQDVNKRPLNNI